MIALRQAIVKLYETWRASQGGTYHSNYQYARLTDGRWVFRMRSDHTRQRRASMAWTQWKLCEQAEETLLARDYEEVPV